MSSIEFTLHGKKRASQRCIRQEAIAFALENGLKIHRQGRIFHVVLSRDLSSPQQDRFRDVVVLTDLNWKVITTYKNRHAISKIERASKINRAA